MTGLGRDTQLHLLKSILKEIIAWVEERKRSVDEEIGSYPTPIPNCDAGFNHLLEQRARLSYQLSQLKTPAEECIVPGDYVELIVGFLRELDGP